MQTRTKRTLIYSFFLLFIMACRTWGCNNSETVKTADDTSGFSDDFRCHRFIQIAADLPLNGFACTLACPTGTHTFDLYDKEPKDFFTMTISEIQAQYCPGGAPAQLSGSDAQPTEPPTEEPAAIEPPTDPAPLNPFLTEEFTTCDNKARYVNFSIAENAPPYDPATFKVTFNGYPVNCALAANNPGIFTCNYPPVSYEPPAGVQVFIGEELVNEFDFNGGEICDPAPQPKIIEPEPTEEPVNPAPTEDPGGSG